MSADIIQVTSFEEIRQHLTDQFKQAGVDTIYKVRNWSENHHPEFLTKGEMYFSPPKFLNDPYDLSRPTHFDTTVIHEKSFFNRLVSSALELGYAKTEAEANIAAYKRLEIIKKDPEKYFLDNYITYVESDYFNDIVGVLSLTTKVTNNQLWGYYGGGQKGFAVGFDPIKLCELLFEYAKPGFVDYTDEIRASGIINQNGTDFWNEFFVKNTGWKLESEYRFVALLASKNDRFRYFSPELVKEIILGPRMRDDEKEKVIKTKNTLYPDAQLIQMKLDYKNGTMVKEPM